MTQKENDPINDPILTNGFIKKTQSTPTREIEKAKKYRADYPGERGISDECKI